MRLWKVSVDPKQHPRGADHTNVVAWDVERAKHLVEQQGYLPLDCTEKAFVDLHDFREELIRQQAIGPTAPQVRLANAIDSGDTTEMRAAFAANFDFNPWGQK